MIDPIRIDHAERLYVAGRSPRSIQRTLAKAYTVDARTARRYLARAKARITKRGEHAPNPDAGRARSESMLLEAARFAREQQDPKALALCAQRLAELDGALGPKRVEISGPGGAALAIDHRHTLTPDALSTRITALAAGLASSALAPDAPAGASGDDSRGAG